MEQDIYKTAQAIDKQILIWAIVFLFAAGLIMFRLIANQLSAILKQLQVTVDKLVLGFERHSVILETHADDIEIHTAEIKELQKRKTR